MMTRKLVTIIGLGPFDAETKRYGYTPTRYVLGGEDDARSAALTEFIAVALHELLAPTEVVLLGTEKARAAHGGQLARLLPGARVETIPDGRTEKELWELFAVLKRELDVRPRDGESAELVLDITHGFRSQPFFAAAVVSFLRATKPLSVRPRIFYGAFEQRVGDRTPILELTPFVELLDAAVALQIFLRTGQGEEVGTSLDELGRGLKRSWARSGKHGPQPPALPALASAIRAFGRDFATVRTGDLLFGGSKNGAPSSEILAREIAASREGIAEHAPPFLDALDEVRGWVECLPPRAADGSLLRPSDIGPAQVRLAMARLAREYVRRGRYSEAIAVAREGAISGVDDESFLPGPAGERSASYDRSKRIQAEERWKRTYPSSRALAGTRNDLLHAGFQVQPTGASALCSSVERFVEELGRELPRPSSEGEPANPMFANVSNHPLAEWKPPQLEAARALAPVLVDVDFPDVSPDADDEALDALAKTTATRVPRSTTHALVMGEMSLAFRLIEILQARRITCLAATTNRRATTDAQGGKTSWFEFVRFRRYRGACGGSDED